MTELPTDAFYDLTTISEVAVSPGGDRVAFVAHEFDPDEDDRRQSVFVVPTDGSRDPHRLTRVADASGVTWSPDGDRLGVVMAREEDTELRVGRDESDDETESDDAEDDADDDSEAADEENDEADDDENGSDEAGDEPKPQVWVYDLALGGDARQVTEREEGVRGFDWGPDGERVVVAARDPTEDEQEYLDQRRDDGPIETERLQHKFDGAGWLDTVTTYLFVVDVETREERRLDDASGGGIFEAAGGLQPAWHPERDRIAFVSYRGDDPDDTYIQDIFVVDADGGDAERVTDGAVTAGAPAWSPDGSRLAFTARDPENWYVPTDVRVAEYPGDGSRAVTGDLDRTLTWFGRPRWLDETTLLAGVADEGWSRFVRLDADADADRDDGPAHERVFERQSRGEAHHQFDADGDAVAVVASRPDGGADLHTMAVGDLDVGPDDTDPRRQLTDLNPSIRTAYSLPSTRRVTVDSDGTDVEAVVYHPPDVDVDALDEDGDRDPLPMLLWIHGGPMSYDEPAFDFDATFWTSRGYLVCKVNYRGSTSYGRAFSEVLKGAWNTVEVADLLAGTDAMVERGWADPDRLFVGGFSQGGVNTAYVLTRTDRFRAGVAEHGVYDMRSSFGTDDSHRWFENDFGLPWEEPEAYDAASSLPDVDAIDTPVLLTAGGQDWRCPPTQSEQLYRALRKRGVESKLVVYPDEHHNIGAPDRATHRLETIDAWLARFDPGRDAESTDSETTE